MSDHPREGGDLQRMGHLDMFCAREPRDWSPRTHLSKDDWQVLGEKIRCLPLCFEVGDCLGGRDMVPNDREPFRPAMMASISPMDEGREWG